jgi:two-component system, NtrC family, sensor kinase
VTREARATTTPPPLRPTPERLLEGVLALGRDIHLGMDERSLADRFLRTLADLFPARVIAVRLVDPRTLERQQISTEGARFTAAALRGPLVLKRSSLDKTRLDPIEIAAGRVRVVDVGARELEPVFEGMVGGFSIPLVAGGEIYGVLDVAYPREPNLGDEDEPTLIPIANHLSVALRNVRLHAETTFLRDYLGKLIDHADALIVGVGRDWRITVVNQAMARLTGFHPDEIIGRDIRRWLPPRDRGRLTSFLADGLAGRAIQPFEAEVVSKGGRSIRTVWNVAPVRGAEQPHGHGRQIEAVVAVGQDLTRVLSLERQVIQAEKLATLGQLAAGVVHELNNPLTSIIVYAEYLAKKLERAQPPTEAGDVEKIRRILEGAERILNFSRNLVQYAKPTSEHLDVVSLDDVIRQSVSFCEHVLRKPEIELVLDLAGDLPPIYAVRGQLTQVVINLLTNAAQALSPSGGALRVHSFRRGVDKVGVAVEDNGVGIRPEDRQRIFEPFFTTKTDGKGTGLGLSIVHNIIERHRGEIEVDSLPGRGTVFTVVIPTGH